MELYLGSSDLGNKVQELQNWIKKNGNNIILIPNALDVMYNNSEKQRTINNDKEMLEEAGFDVKIVSLEEYFEKFDNLKNDFEQYKAFYAIGGNVFSLRKAMELSGFDKYLKEKSMKEDVLYGGYSAGICVLAKKLSILKLADSPRNPYNDEDVLEEGIGLIDFLPIPHYKSEFPVGDIIDKIVSYCDRHGIRYKTLKNGEAIVESTRELER